MTNDKQTPKKKPLPLDVTEDRPLGDEPTQPVVGTTTGISAEGERLIDGGIGGIHASDQSQIIDVAQPIITFRPDGTVEINPTYTIDEAAKAFWDKVKDLAHQAWMDEGFAGDSPEQALAKMRAKLRISGIFPTQAGDMEVMRFHGVAKSDGPYPADGSDENNTYAKFSPSVDLQLLLANPNLVGTFEVGDVFYVDFIPAPK